jgi:hypothetical protein
MESTLFTPFENIKIVDSERITIGIKTGFEYVDLITLIVIR